MVIAYITDPESGRTEEITLEDVWERYDYTADRNRACEILQREYSAPEYSLRINTESAG